MKKVRLSMTILDTLEFNDDTTEEKIDSYIDSINIGLQKVLDKAGFGEVNDIEYSIEKVGEINE